MEVFFSNNSFFSCVTHDLVEILKGNRKLWRCEYIPDLFKMKRFSSNYMNWTESLMH